MKKIFFMLLLTLSASCTHVTLRYSSNLETRSGATGTVRYTQSYPTYETAIGCALSFFIYGGWCWYYVGMPGDSQRERIKADTEDYLSAQFKEPFTLGRASVTNLGWGYQDASVSLKLVGAEEEEEEDDDNVKESRAAKKPAKKETVTVVNENPSRTARNYLDRKHTIKLLFPYFLGIGLATENPVNEKVDLELGFAGTVGAENNTALYVQTKYIISAKTDYHLKFGVVGMKVFAESFGGREYKYASGGIVVDYLSYSGRGLQFMHIPNIKGKILNIGMLTISL